MDKIIDRSRRQNFTARANVEPVRMRAIATLLISELDNLRDIQQQLEIFENKIAEDRDRLVYLRDQFDDCSLDPCGRLHTGEKLLRTLNRIQQTLEQSCSEARWRG